MRFRWLKRRGALLFKRGVHVVPIYGGQSYDRQFRAVEAGVQIVIGTPGRYGPHERGTLRLDNLGLVVLDEADRMLDMGFRDDIERILSAVPAQRQLLFFSATMPRAIQELIGRYSKDPAWIRIEAHATMLPRSTRSISRSTATRDGRAPHHAPRRRTLALARLPRRQALVPPHLLALDGLLPLLAAILDLPLAAIRDRFACHYRSLELSLLLVGE